MKTLYMLVVVMLSCGAVACGGEPYGDPVGPAQTDAAADAATVDAADAATEADTAVPVPDGGACGLRCDTSVGWFDTCSSVVLGCPDGGTGCCDPQADGCGCANQGVGGYFCGSVYQGDDKSCQKCGQHCPEADAGTD